MAAQQAAAPVANVPWLPSHPDADPAVLTRSMLEKLPPEKVQQVLQDYRGASTNILRLRNREPRHSIAVQSADGSMLSSGYSVVPDTASDITLASLSAVRKASLTISATRTKLNTGTGQGGTLGQLVGGLPTVFAPGTPWETHVDLLCIIVSDQIMASCGFDFLIGTRCLHDLAVDVRRFPQLPPCVAT